MTLEIDKNLLRAFLVSASIVEAKDVYTGGHLWRVSEFSKLLGEKVGFSKDELFLVSIGGFLHDVGKIGIPDSILGKRGPLDDTEYDIIKTHPKIGFELVKYHPLSVLANDVILHHHEFWNGKGYPDKLHETENSIFSRILGIVDAFDAMTSTRPYRQGMSIEKAFSILESEKGKQFDGTLVDLFLSVPKEKIESIVSHSEPGIPLFICKACGPTIVVFNDSKDGDCVYCRVCGGTYLLHKNKSSFEVEYINKIGKAEERIVKPEITAIELLVNSAPNKLQIQERK